MGNNNGKIASQDSTLEKERPKTNEELLIDAMGEKLNESQWCEAFYDFDEYKRYKDNEDTKELAVYSENGENILHKALKNFKDSEPMSYMCRKLVKDIIKHCPRLMLQSRKNDAYSGQLPLHIAITKGLHKDIVKEILSTTRKRLKTRFSDILHAKATGPKFKNTVMMGQLPLSVAALLFKEDIVELLSDTFGAKLEECNQHGDTVLHSLIKYAAIYPDKTENVKTMLSFLHTKYIMKDMSSLFSNTNTGKSITYDVEQKSLRGIWFMTNNESLTPLQLSAKLGVVDIVEFILKLENLYYFQSAHDGLFDIKMFDITEIDSIANKIEMSSSTNQFVEGVSKKSVDDDESYLKNCRNEKPLSITEMLFVHDYETNDAFHIIQIAPLRRLIQKKWERCKMGFRLWGLTHLAFMVMFTVYAVFKANGEAGSYTDVCSWIAITFGILYLFVTALVILNRFQRMKISYWLKDMQYLAILFVFSVCTFIQAGQKQNHIGDITLCIALLMGWSFNMFFVGPTHMFSFFTELMKQVILKDFISFTMIIFLEYVAFSTSMHIMLRLNSESLSNATDTSGLEQQYDLSFGRTMFMMFKLMIGIEDIDIILAARVPAFAVILYIAFVLLTYILLFNALIGIMSNTSGLVQERRYEYWRIQQLSVVLFLEEILFFQPLVAKLIIGEKIAVDAKDITTKMQKVTQRWFLQMHFVDNDKQTSEEKDLYKRQEIEGNMMNTKHRDEPDGQSVKTDRSNKEQRKRSHKLSVALKKETNIRPTVDITTFSQSPCCCKCHS